MKRLVLFVVVLFAMSVGAAQAVAGNPNAVQVQVTCDNGPSFYTTLPPLGEAAPDVGSTNVFVITDLSYTDTNGVLHVIHSSGANPTGKTSYTCHQIGPTSGIHYTLVGFFTR